MSSVPADDERRHRAGRQRLWAEGWYFDFVADDAALGGSAGLALYPGLATAWYWAALVGAGRRLVTVRDHDVALPRGQSLEIRAGGLWSMFNCETPLDHWSIGLEAFAVALDDPAEALADERGDRVGLGFDLEWEAVGPARHAPAAVEDTGHYEQSCQVHGEVLVGDEQLMIDGWGQRYHRWGVQNWWATTWRRASGRLSDGTAFSAWDGGGGTAVGACPAGAELAAAEIDATWGPDGLLTGGKVSVGGRTLVASAMAQAPVSLDGPDGRRARLLRALCRYRGDDGGVGSGWMEWLHSSKENR